LGSLIVMKLLKNSVLFVLFVYSFILAPFANAAVSAWVDFELIEGHVKIPVEIAGNTGYAILDSGAQLNGINSSFIFKHKLDLKKGKKINVKGVYGTQKRQTYSSVDVDILGQQLPFSSLTEISLGHFENALLLGAPFFAGFILQIDYPNERLRFLSRDALDMDEVKNLNMVKQGGSGMPIVKVRLNNEKSLWLILDTGNSGGLMLERSAASRWLGKYDTGTSLSFGANSMGYSESFRIPEMQFGPFVLENVLVSVPAQGQPSNLGSRFQRRGTRIKGNKVEGLLGFDILKHFVLTVDYAGGRAHVAPPN
jgi:hypothetical protein